jgi:hypothetical protein
VKIGEKMISFLATLATLAAVLMLTSTSPLLDVTDTLQEGATAVYTVSLAENTVYWITLEAVEGQTDFNITVASDEMDFDQFMNLPYREDFLYAVNFAIVSGLAVGNESVTLPSEHAGPVYVIVHDAGGNGGTFSLKIQ